MCKEFKLRSGSWRLNLYKSFFSLEICVALKFGFLAHLPQFSTIAQKLISPDHT